MTKLEYMEHLMNIIREGLANHDEANLILANVVGDLVENSLKELQND